MKLDIGPSIKAVRQKRGYSAKSMYTGLMSRSNYARFEEGAIDTSAANLYELTKRLNVSLPEWMMIYNQLNGRDVGKLTNQVNGLLNAGWTQQDPAQLCEAARICDELYARFQYPNEHLSALMASALATFLQNGQVIGAANAPRSELIAYLDAMDTWYANDVALLSNIMQILDLPTLLRLIVRYLLMVKNNPWLGQGSNSIPSQQEVLQQAFNTAISERDWAAYTKLLERFNAMPMSERYLFPTLMRQVYNAYAAYHQQPSAAALAPVHAVTAVITAADSPANLVELTRQVKALNAWCGVPAN
ncbi:helix-turn-helix domain-containing protein [Lacticaseibacillus nasuensis]|uniref:helix-turn-helix domain-containing protein n=1 Tax=Lacticaseibacillus nasuensis TaxID=944671 RepID=UPI002246CB09|nr:helix-turn-helix transcriptional regulator [Lacticaseibacillus nasuensis]MCX2455238.1 helix-turn-helix domain-containing protein [Lacticaseibacillus nasuensis]